MKRMMAVLAVASMWAVGCAGIEQPKTTALDGHAFRVAVASERGGAPETIEVRFANGSLEASDAQREGAVPGAYVVRASDADTKFEAESRAPGAVRRFKGTVNGARIEGDLEVARDGVPPMRYTFRGEAI